MRVFFRIFLGIGCVCLFIFKKQIMKRMGIPDEKTYWLRMLAYSLAGLTILVLKQPLFHLVGITNKTPIWIVILAYIPLVSTTYTLGFIVFGTLLGQKEFVLGQAMKRVNFILGRFKNVKH